MSGCLLNKSECRKLALRWGASHRSGWGPTRVAASFLDDIEARVRLMITGAVSKHRTVGKTIKDYQ
jgi:hypothetical protein